MGAQYRDPIAESSSTPNQSSDRPLLRGWSHVLAAIAAIALAPIVIAFTPGGSGRAAAAVYSVGVICLFGVSGFYHRVAWPTRFYGFCRRLDHSMIFVFIAATYTPFAVLSLEGAASTFLLWFVWAGALVGVAIRLWWLDAPRWVTVAPYLVVGWSALPVIDDLWAGIGGAGFALLLIGGVLYTVGGGVYAAKAPNPSPKWFGYHEVFHLLVVAAVAVHYVAVAFFALPNAV